MKPEVDQILGLTAAQLLAEIAPLLPASYAQSSTGLLSIMLVFCAQEFDRAADIRAAENADMRRLVGELAAFVGDAALKTKITAASKSTDASLRISDLNAANYELRRLLIALQSHFEDNDARDAQAKIWLVLKTSAERRLLKLPGA
ncbi:MAG TPA: hypothetical protein VIJ85_14105 [Rhizomicrobium sp.]